MPHCDAPTIFGPQIWSVSLGSGACVMRFSRDAAICGDNGSKKQQVDHRDIVLRTFLLIYRYFSSADVYVQ